MRWILILTLLLGGCTALEPGSPEGEGGVVSAAQYNSCLGALRGAVEATYSEILADSNVAGLPGDEEFRVLVSERLPFGLPIAAGSTITPEEAMKELRMSIASARASYSEIVEAARSEGVEILEGEAWRGAGLPLPATFTRYLAERIPESTGFVFRVRSLYPLNPGNGPATSRERAAMESVHASTSGEEVHRQVGDRTHLWVYPEVATVQSCVDCHNQHPNRLTSYPEFELGGVMGALVSYIEIDGG